MNLNEVVVIGVFGMVGAAVPEVLRVVSALRAGRWPSGKEYVASILLVFLGWGALFFKPDPSDHLEAAVLGAAFPQLFSSAVAAAAPPKSTDRSSKWNARSVMDYIAWRI